MKKYLEDFTNGNDLSNFLINTCNEYNSDNNINNNNERYDIEMTNSDGLGYIHEVTDSYYSSKHMGVISSSYESSIESDSNFTV